MVDREVEAELTRINISRNRFAYTIQYALLVLSVWYQTNFLHPLSAFILALGGCGCLFRFFATEIIPDERKISDLFLWLGFGLLSAAWVVYIDQAVRLHTMSGETIPLLRVLVGVIILTNHAFLVADIKSHYFFLVPISLGLLLEVFYLENMSGYPILSFFTIALLSTLGLHHQHRQLRAFVSARIEANREKNKMRKLIDGVPGFVGILGPDGTYEDGNAAIRKVFPKLIGTKIGELSGDSSYARFLKSFFHSGKDYDTQETQVMLKGEIFHLVTTCRRLDNGGMIVINIPINELVETRRELREKEAVALYSTKLASIGQMAAGVAHEVNNPLAIIQGSASIISSLVNEEPIDRPNLKLFSDRIVATSDRIAQIVRSLRSLTRGGEQDPFSPISVKNLLSSCQDLSSHNLKRFDVQLMLPENQKDMTILGREVQLGQVLLNLIANSIDAVKNLPERWVKVDYGHKDGVAWMEVSGSGRGIPPEIVEKMMEPFFTTKKDEGTGLGLAISSKIVEEHGGKLSYVNGTLNTTFRVQFPTPKI